MSAIPGISRFLHLFEETVRNKFIPVTSGDYICNERQLSSHPIRYSGLTIPILHELAETEFENPRKITSELTPLIIYQSIRYNISETKVKQLNQNGFKKTATKAVYKN